jgi:hypothetical protein
LNENFPAYHLCTAQTFHSNSPVRLKKSLWDSRTTATLVRYRQSIVDCLWPLTCSLLLFQTALTLKSKCFLINHDWADASKTADVVLAHDRKNVKAMLVKAEAIFNVCQFEHSLVLFFRGLVC